VAREEGGDPDLFLEWGGERRKMAAQEQEHEKQQAKTSTTSSLPSSSERSSSSAPNNLREGGRCRAQPMHHPLSDFLHHFFGVSSAKLRS